jgi:hypothetical protein
MADTRAPQSIAGHHGLFSFYASQESRLPILGLRQGA